MAVIFLHQLHDNLRSLRFQASLIVLLLFFVGNGIVYSYKMDRAAEEIVRTSCSDEGRYDAVETLDQAVSAGYKIDSLVKTHLGSIEDAWIVVNYDL